MYKSITLLLLPSLEPENIEHSISIKAREKYEDWARQPHFLLVQFSILKPTVNTCWETRKGGKTWDKISQHLLVLLALLSLLQLILK